MQEHKNNYVAPRIEVIEVENEGVMASSSPDNFPGGGGLWGQNTFVEDKGCPGVYENIINDILS